MNRLRELREARGLSLRALGEKTGIDYSNIAYYEKDQRNFSAKTQQVLAEFFGVSIDYLLGREARAVTFTDHPQNRLKELRMAHGLSVRALSEKVGIDPSTISFVENDSRSMTVRNLIKLCKFFRVSTDYMLGLKSGEDGIPLAVMPEEVDDREAVKKHKRSYFRESKLGYTMVYMPESPMAGKEGWVFVHRVVMAKSIGRDLRPEEVVHHIDGNPRNNALSNLMLFANNSEHRRYHGQHKRDNVIEELLNK